MIHVASRQGGTLPTDGNGVGAFALRRFRLSAEGIERIFFWFLKPLSDEEKTAGFAWRPEHCPLTKRDPEVTV